MFNIISDLSLNSKNVFRICPVYIYSIYMKKLNQMNSAQASKIF